MPAWLTVLCIVGGIVAYVVTGGVVHAIVQRIAARFDMLDGAEDMFAILWPLFAILWPLFAILGPIVGVGWYAGRLGVWAGGYLVDAIVEWHQRPKVPRATARHRKAGGS